MPHMPFHIPFTPTLWGHTVPVHLILEYLAFFVAFRYYLYLRRGYDDAIPSGNRLSIILGATLGALVGSRLVGFMENPVFGLGLREVVALINVKTIMGGLFGGLLGVELAKKTIGERHSSGDLFTLPIMVGIMIGRVGCFLSGIDEFTYGMETTFFMGMDLGDGLRRHPIALYEIVFLAGLFVVLRHWFYAKRWPNGVLFQVFMLCYFGFRFCMEFLKPNVFFILGLSSIQWLCLVCYAYYHQTLYKTARYAYQKIHIL